MKILVLGDIHGKTCWHKIVDSDDFDKIIFLGDYVSTHGPETAEQQLQNLRDILDWREHTPAEIIMLRGNHDMQHLGYHWAECSGWDSKVYKGLMKMKDEFLRATQWAHLECIGDKKCIFSHAGISKTWLTKILYNTSLEEILSNPGWINNINKIEPDERFGFTPCRFSDLHGDSETQPPTWIRPVTLWKDKIDGYTQIVGHTPVIKSCANLSSLIGKEDVHDDIWLCDALDVGSYLVINDEVFNVHNISELCVE